MTNETRAAALDALADRIEAGEKTDHMEIARLLDTDPYLVMHENPLQDLQTAADLCAEVLPGAVAGIFTSGMVEIKRFGCPSTCVTIPDRPAAALTAAVCRAKAAEIRENEDE